MFRLRLGTLGALARARMMHSSGALRRGDREYGRSDGFGNGPRTGGGSSSGSSGGSSSGGGSSGSGGGRGGSNGNANRFLAPSEDRIHRAPAKPRTLRDRPQREFVGRSRYQLERAAEANRLAARREEKERRQRMSKSSAHSSHDRPARRSVNVQEGMSMSDIASSIGIGRVSSGCGSGWCVTENDACGCRTLPRRGSKPMQTTQRR